MVICWLIGSVNESIARSIMFIGTASEIWNQLEKRFALSDGSRKYTLNKDTYGITRTVISVVSQEVFVFFVALSKQKEDQRLFQFLNGRVLMSFVWMIKSTALLSKGKFKEKCGICGFKWHQPEKC
ncbi:hypothetical protein CTI12_AA217270 [Artemisia annua]|uniref:Uncharacterized protein n=1 Tax=Artemisia annua TaxID=35608 RepID=A0A2U1NX66_ARTAN|nr:hypothetical protein CTI12_AA217270 [Artemisia annua]